MLFSYLLPDIRAWKWCLDFLDIAGGAEVPRKGQGWWEQRPGAGEQSQEDVELQRGSFSRSAQDRRGDTASPHQCQPVSRDHHLCWLQHNKC